MISAILYGRNDSHGYNLHKRAALSLNCIAEMLTDPNDEMIFIDCNSPDDFPTFPEAIADTLTDRVKKLLKIYRVRPEIYHRYKKNSPLPVLEPLMRNIALRRTNPANRWILSTNPDMIFIPWDKNLSLSEVAKILPDGIYEAPRFELQETLWEILDRKQPLEAIEQVKQWAIQFRLNHTITASYYALYDGPGDFQLMLRDQLFKIDGFNEEMTLGWHVDSNICKRLWLLNNNCTCPFPDVISAYHCSHTLTVGFAHSAQHTENNMTVFCEQLTEPYLPEQRETWGMPNENLEEIRLTSPTAFVDNLKSFLPLSKELQKTQDHYPGTIENIDLCSYENERIFPFMAVHLFRIPPSCNVGYIGWNRPMLEYIHDFRKNLNHQGKIFADFNFLTTDNIQPPFEESFVANKPMAEILQTCDVVVVDASLKHTNDASPFGEACKNKESYFIQKLNNAIVFCARAAQKRQAQTQNFQIKFIFVGANVNSIGVEAHKYFDLIRTPYLSAVMQGHVKKAT